MATASGVAGQGGRRQAVATPVLSRLVSKPIPKAQTDDPREFQLGQIRRRFSPKEFRRSSSESGEDAVVLSFSMAPSDPDFPFDMDKLQCSLVVPTTYPGPDPKSKPRLKVTNKDMPRGFAINVERGFDGLVEERNDATLLALMSALDKNLEKFLSEKKVETIKLVPNADTRHLATLPARSVGASAEQVAAPAESSTSKPIVSAKPVEVFTDAQKTEARSKREMETRQLEARMGRLPLYKKSADGIAYTIPIEPRKRSELAPALRLVKAVQLFVPLLYPLQSCRIQLEDIKPEDAEITEGAFEEHAKQARDMSLMGHINYLAQNFHILSKKPPPPESKVTKSLVEKENTLSTTSGIPQATAAFHKSEDDRSHIQIIPRPPEWTVLDTSDSPDTDGDYSYDSGDDSEDGGAEIELTDPENAQMPEKNPERGTSLSFPFIELHGIELLELTTLNVIIKCERCKETTEFTSLKSNTPQSSSCKKCAALLKVTFRHELIHANAIRAGFLDLEGGTPTDLLPSTFTPTCSSCSTPYTSTPGFICIRGSTISQPCRTCHQKLTISIPSVRFLRITAAASTSATGPRRKRDVPLGVVTGTELPDRGRCRHYAKSYRWFRFSCCERVYPCDKCHDEKEEHANEHANRMICGWCSREQVYRPEECAFCGKGVVGRRGKGFWEGGRGTRDRVRMSRKDPRKFKRVGGGGKEKEKEKA
jgi:uncharacterized CHY-type Zn-finger protein